MEGKCTIKTSAVLFLSFCLFSNWALAQTEQEKLADIIVKKDSLFWITYNNCDTTQFENFFTKDVEFYHDKGGMTLGLEMLALSIKKNVCGNKDYRLRREAVPGTVRVFPLEKADTIYGAIMTGEHLFYIQEKGKEEKLDGRARFTHLWLLKNGSWKITRILSFDHGPAVR